MHQYITVMKEHEFVLWVIGAHACDRGKFVYELPDNVVEVHEVFLDDALLFLNVVFYPIQIIE